MENTTLSLAKVFRQAWDKKTCFPPVKPDWNSDKPELGQCAVTALIIQDKFGGDIVYNSEFDHYWNVLPSGRKMDLTKNQFPTRVKGSAVIVDRHEILHSANAKKFKTLQRYELLKNRLESLEG